jgi:hypothetical protein
LLLCGVLLCVFVSAWFCVLVHAIKHGMSIC